jgi:hypothetical protein
VTCLLHEDEEESIHFCISLSFCGMLLLSDIRSAMVVVL